MASTDNQRQWLPYYGSKDCSQGFCTLYCPQWCYVIFPPPPPSGFPIQASSLKFSPLVIAIIGILACAFLLICYYIIVSKYCRNLESLRGRFQQGPNEEFEDGRHPLYHEPWQIATTGLDETVIKSIAVCKYKKEDGFVEGTDCAVCLSEFREDESLRLLPKCSHAFHLHCIDTWLRSHSNCPLCRATISSATSPLPLQLPPLLPESLPNDGSSMEIQDDNEEVAATNDLERGATEESRVSNAVVSKYLPRALSDLGGTASRDIILEIEDEEIQPIRRVASTPSFHSRVSIADLMHISMEGDFRGRDCLFSAGFGSMIKRCRGYYSKGYKRSGILHSVMSPIAMKRSSSSRRHLSPRHGRRYFVKDHLKDGNGLALGSVGLVYGGPL